MNIKAIFKGNAKLDRKITKFYYGVEEVPKMLPRGRIVKGITFFLYQAFLVFTAFSVTWFMATGTFPFGPQPVSVGPTGVVTNFTAEQIEKAVGDNPPVLLPYGEGNNCVELSLIAARQLWWDGYWATVVKLDFSSETGHMLVGVLTSDVGWKFYEPGNKSWVNPTVGSFYLGEQIIGVYYLTGWTWEPIVMEVPK